MFTCAQFLQCLPLVPKLYVFLFLILLSFLLWIFIFRFHLFSFFFFYIFIYIFSQYELITFTGENEWQANDENEWKRWKKWKTYLIIINFKLLINIIHRENWYWRGYVRCKRFAVCGFHCSSSRYHPSLSPSLSFFWFFITTICCFYCKFNHYNTRWTRQ